METRSALVLRGIRKTYPGVVAVDGVDLDVAPGEIHALVGENGAGKSTLATIAFGTLPPDEGTVQASGTVGLVHQHFELIGRLRVWQNVLLGREPRAGWRVDVRAARERVRAIAKENNLEIDPDDFVDDLPVGIQQRVELLRELERSPAVLLLDEPTAALAPAEIEGFFTTVKALAARGTAVLIITHKLQEVLAHTSRVTVMRHGKIVARFATAQTSADEIARAMVGGDLPHIAQPVAISGEVKLRVEHLRAGSGSNAVHDLSFSVRAGEIVGIAGVEGNGQTALGDALAGMTPYSGTIEYAGRAGIIPQDRQREALVLDWSIADNIMLGRQQLTQNRRGVVLNRDAARSQARSIGGRFDVRAASIDVPVRTLSGGNQQKVVVGRALIDTPPVILAYQPTRGIDVGAAALVQSRLVEARNAGAAIVLVSFELDELLALADRILVLYRGAIAGTFQRGSFDRGAIGALMAGSAA